MNKSKLPFCTLLLSKTRKSQEFILSYEVQFCMFSQIPMFSNIAGQMAANVQETPSVLWQHFNLRVYAFHHWPPRSAASLPRTRTRGGSRKIHSSFFLRHFYPADWVSQLLREQLKGRWGAAGEKDAAELHPHSLVGLFTILQSCYTSHSLLLVLKQNNYRNKLNRNTFEPLLWPNLWAGGEKFQK